MTNRDAYNIWAPYGASWTKYARPVAFCDMPEFKDEQYKHFFVPPIKYIDKFDKKCAYIVDLPSENSIEEGLAIAKYGYRPIPLFNGTIEPINSTPTTDNRALERPLAWGANIIKDMKFESDAPPVFLVDLSRQNRYKVNISVFDNSYDMYAQDFPTAKALLDSGIDKVIVRTDKFQNDMRMILSDYQKKGIKIFQANNQNDIKKVRIRKPLLYKN